MQNAQTNNVQPNNVQQFHAIQGADQIFEVVDAVVRKVRQFVKNENYLVS